MHSPNSRDALDSRFAQRWSVHYKVQFAYPDYAGEGMTLDMSAGGLCIITDREIAPGVEMYARVVFPDNAHLDVQTATVKWCENGQIGLEISEMERQDVLRLLQLLSRLGGSAITYSRIVEAMEGPLLNIFTSVSQQLRGQLSRSTPR